MRKGFLNNREKRRQGRRGAGWGTKMIIRLKMTLKVAEV